MSRGSGAVRWASRVAVLSWGAFALMTLRLEVPLPIESAERLEPRALVRPLPQEPSAPEIAEAEPASPHVARQARERAPPASERVEAGDALRGSRLLVGGDFPVLSCSYESFPSFLAYARSMAALGARFVVVQHKRIVGSIDIDSGALGAPALDGAYSPRARDYTGEPRLARLARSARNRFGSGAVVMMLVPRELDAVLFGGIARVLAERGDHHGAYREIRGRYERGADGIRLHVDAGVRPDGTRVDLDLLFDLGARSAFDAEREAVRYPGAT